MKIAVYKTGHQIADTVAEALKEGFHADIQETSRANDSSIRAYQTHIAYGILRGTSEVFRSADKQGVHWFNCDRGYWGANHYDGYYRISYKGTQAKWDPAFSIAKEEYEGELESWKYLRQGSVVICPPTDAVCHFFGISPQAWLNNAIQQANNGFLMPSIAIHHKSDNKPIRWEGCLGVITFNSSVGWQALQRGIPCLSDPEHSVVGSYYGTNSIDSLLERFNSLPRKPLFNFMRAHQFTLREISEGLAWPIINHYISSSVGMAAKPLPPMSPRTVYESAPKQP